MRIVQIFDQTTPFVSGYSMRSRYITDSLHKLGVTIDAYSSPAFQYDAMEQKINGTTYYRTQVKSWDVIKKFPVLKECFVVNAVKKTIAAHWDKNTRLIDAHSSPVNGRSEEHTSE